MASLAKKTASSVFQSWRRSNMFMDYFFLKNDPQRVNEPRKVKQKRQHQAYPKL
jgi:transcriptional regulator of acetoin/glycerol metabolism